MFFVYNKDRIISVAIAFGTVLVLFLMAGVINKNNDKNSIETSTNTKKEVILSNENNIVNENEIEHDN